MQCPYLARYDGTLRTLDLPTVFPEAPHPTRASVSLLEEGLHVGEATTC
jgi:hypothetical protein